MNLGGNNAKYIFSLRVACFLKLFLGVTWSLMFSLQAQENKLVFEEIFKLPLSWKHSENALIQTGNEGTCMSLRSSDKKNCSIWISLLNLEKDNFYEIELFYKNIQPGKNAIMVKLRDNDKASINNNEIPASSEWKSFKMVFRRNGDSRVSLSIVGNNILLRNLSVRKTDRPDNTICIGKNVYQFIPRQKYPDPVSEQGNVSMPVFYKRPLRMVYPESVPQDFELIKELRTFSVPGEYACWNFIVYDPQNTFSIEDVSVSDLCSQNGQIIKGTEIKVNYVKFWKKPTSGHAYAIMPELILPFSPAVSEENKNNIFWLQTRLPENIMGGGYEGEITLKSRNGIRKLPVYLRVFPFMLKTPTTDEMAWSVYARMHTIPQRTYSRALKMKYLKDMKDYGVSSLVHTATSENSIREIQELRKATCMNGPLVIKSTLGRKSVEKFAEKPFSEAKDIDDIQKDFILPLQNIDQWMKKYGAGKYAEWYFFETDEPHCGNRMPHAMLEIQLIKSTGVGTAYPVYPYDAIKSMGPYLNISINSFIANNETSLNRYMALAKKHNLRYWYLGGGAYMGQDGGLMPNRLLSGMLSFKSGVSGHVSYTYQNYTTELGKDPLDNFTNGRSYGMTYPAPNPSPEKVTIPTLEWEGIREGITDYKYLYTLRFYISEAEKKGLYRQAEAGKKVLSEILGYIPWGEDYKTGDYLLDSGNFTDDKAAKLRCMAAQEIIKLKEVMK